jgi:DMSO reductase anchor subunit
MSPEYSIILLTVFAGAGQGLFIFLVAGDALGLINGVPLDSGVMIVGSIVSLVLTVGGVGSSFLHLTHPERGIKTVKQWKSSWLSLEAGLLPVFMGLVALYGACVYYEVASSIRLIVGGAGALSGLFLYLASGMIYAVVRYIKEWNTTYTPISFTLIGLATGGACQLALLEMMNAPHSTSLQVLRGAFGITLVAMIIKLASYLRNRRLYQPINIQSALGINHPDIVLMDMGIGYTHYNTKEYAYKGYKDSRSTIRVVSIVTLFILPLALLTFGYMPHFRGVSTSLGFPAALLMIGGALMERWLFFVDGSHIQNLYYGGSKDFDSVNPILQAAKKGAPLPPG